MEIIMKNAQKNVEIPSLLDEKTAALLLSVSYEKLRKKIRPQNKIAFLRLGKSIKYSLADLKAYLARCRVEAKD
jgi:excisionase family DNA binding protein